MGEQQKSSNMRTATQWIIFLHIGCLLGVSSGIRAQPADRVSQIKLALARAKALDGIHADSVAHYAALAQTLLVEDDALRLQYDVYRSLARSHYLQSQPADMRAASEVALKLGQQIGDSLLIAAAYRSLAMATPAVSPAEAKGFIQQAIQFSQSPTASHQRFRMLAYQIQAYLIKYEAPQKAQAIRLKILQQALELQDTLLIAKSYETIGTYYRNLQIDSAIYFYSQARRIYEQVDEKSLLAGTFGKLGTCYQVKDLRDSVLYFGDQAYQLAKQSGNVAAQRSGMRILINHYLDQGELEEARAFAEELLALDQEKPSGYRSLIYLDLGKVHHGMGEGEKAYAYYQQALEQATADGYPPGIATARFQLGEAELQAGNLSPAAQQFRIVDDMYARMNIEAARVQTLERLGQIALRQGDMGQARPHFAQLLATSEKLGDISAQAAAHRGLARCDSAQGRLTSAFQHLAQFSTLTDSFHRNNFTERVAALQTQLETERKEGEINLLKQEATLQQSQLAQAQSERNFYRTLGISALLITLVVGLFLFLLYKSRIQIQSQADELRSLNRTKDDLFGIIAHDLKGPISGFQVLGRVFSRYLPENSPQRLWQITQQLEQQSTHLNRLLDNLLQWALQQLGQYQSTQVPFSLEALIKEMADLHSPAALAKGNALNLEVPENYVIEGDPRGWSIVLNNLLSNAMKFTEGGSIDLMVDDSSREQPQLIIRDSGIGMNPAQLTQLTQQQRLVSTKGTLGERGTGLGLRIVQQLLTDWGLSLSIESQEGLGTTLRIDLPQQKASAERLPPNL